MPFDSSGEVPYCELRTLVLKVRSGATPRGGAGAYISKRLNFALVRSQNVFDYRFEPSGLAYITDAQARELAGAELEPNDVLLNITGDGVTFGRSCLVPSSVLPACVNQHVMLIRANPEKCVAGYLAAWLALPETKAYIESFNAGGSRRAITKGHIEAFMLPLPPLEIQREIAAFVVAINDRIDILRQTSATLESIAQALFKSWFIDFDPVRAKAEGREPEGMDAATAALFPDEFDESALGLIPKGWRVRSLDSFASYLNGLALQKYPPESDDEFLPVIKIAQLRAGNTVGADRASARLKSEYVAKDGDVLFSWSGSLEVEFWCGGDGALNQHLFKVTSNEVPKWFYYMATRHFLPGFREIAAHKATTMGHIQRKHLTEAMLALPEAAVIRELGLVVGPLMERRIANALQGRELARLRDTLLPRLISGKLRLPEAQAQLEEALS